MYSIEHCVTDNSRSLEDLSHVCLYRTILGGTGFLVGINIAQLPHPFTPSLPINAVNLLLMDFATKMLVKNTSEMGLITDWTSLSLSLQLSSSFS